MYEKTYIIGYIVGYITGTNDEKMGNGQPRLPI